LYAGIKHLTHPEKILDRVAKSGLYESLNMPAVFSASILLSGIAMIIGALLLLFGYKQKQAALMLLFILIPITLMVQLENLNDLGPFFKNVAISGSLLFILKYNTHEVKKHHHSNSAATA